MPGINKAIARRIIQEIVNEGNLVHIEELVASDVILHDTNKELNGFKELRECIVSIRTAFPDIHYTVDELLADRDKVILRCTGTGTHLGSFRGIAATGKKMNYTVILIWRFWGARLCEHWSVGDVYGILQQLKGV